jgi:hypothetical protein
VKPRQHTCQRRWWQYSCSTFATPGFQDSKASARARIKVSIVPLNNMAAKGICAEMTT